MSRLARATAVMSLGTVLSRVTGLLRLAAITAALGIFESHRLTDTFNLANTAPNIIYELVLGGVLTSVFVPVFVELLEKEGRERAWEVLSGIINLSLLVLIALSLIAVLAAPLIALFYAGRLEGADAVLQREIMTFLLRLFLPQIVFYGLAAVTAGVLNAHRRFGPPMFTPILNNLVVIAVFVAFHQIYARVDFRTISRTQLLVIGLGTTVGVALMSLAQLPFLRGLGKYRLTLSLGHPSVRKLARLSIYVIGYVVANQIGYLIVQWLANAQTGGYSAYISAFTFFLLPHGLFAVSVITALLPGMSEHAIRGDWDDFRARLSTGVRSTFLLVLPAAVGYIVLGEAIVRFLLEHGVMTQESTELVAGVLQLFVLGLVPFAVFQLFLRAFYAMQDTKTPFLINCAAVALNTAVNIPMFHWFGVRGLAAGHAIAYTFGVVVQGRVLSKRIGGLDEKKLLRSGLRIGAASAAMGLTVWAGLVLLRTAIQPGSLISDAALVALPVALGAVAFVGFAHLFDVEELGFVRSLVKRRGPV